MGVKVAQLTLVNNKPEWHRMYGKLFTQMYDGTLGTAGPWQALVTFQQLIILADKDGSVDMTTEAISRRTTIPLDIIQIGIAALEQPDPYSRTPDEEGRRIIRLNDERNWGWRIVNYTHYRNIRSAEERREYMRLYQRKRRLKTTVNNPVNNVSKVNQSKGSKQEAEAEAITTTTVVGLDATAWDTWMDYRKKIGKPLKPVSIPAAQKKMALLGDSQMASVEHSIANGWTGLFPADKPSGRKETTAERVRRLNSTESPISGIAKRVDR